MSNISSLNLFQLTATQRENRESPLEEEDAVKYSSSEIGKC
jgi:hypothetical protein